VAPVVLLQGRAGEQRQASIPPISLISEA